VLADSWAKRYGRRPSEFLRPGERDEEVDAALDIACMQAGSAEDVREAARGGGVMFVRVV
jgi:hypothetical protein